MHTDVQIRTHCAGGAACFCFRFERDRSVASCGMYVRAKEQQRDVDSSSSSRALLCVGERGAAAASCAA